MATSDEDWVNAFERIRTDPDLRQKMVLEARQTAETEYDVRILAKSWVEIMEDVRSNCLGGKDPSAARDLEEISSR